MFGLGLVEILILAFILLWLVPLVPLIFYLLTLHRSLAACSVESRRMEPRLVWLQIIPLFGMVWQFFVVLAVSGSLRAEFERRGMTTEPNPGQSLGLAMCILSVCGFIPFLGLLAVLAGFVCWILYWIEIAGLKGKLVPVA